MNTTLKQQIQAIQEARKSFFYQRDIYDGLNDAGSTIAALNLNPDREKRIKELESALRDLLDNQDFDTIKRARLLLDELTKTK